MKFNTRIEKLFGIQYMLNGIVDKEAVMFLDSPKKKKQNDIINLALKGDLVALYMCSLIIDFIRDSAPSCKIEPYNVYVFEETKGKEEIYINAYGEQKEAKKLIKKNKAVIFEDKIIEDPLISEKDFSAFIGKDSFSTSLFGEEIIDNISIARIIKLEKDGKLFAWNRKTEKLSQNPLIALAQAINMYGENCFIEKKGIFYPNPDIMVNLPFLSTISSQSLQKRFIYRFLYNLKDAYAYYMNLEGLPIRIYQQHARQLSFFNKEVIIPKELLHESWVEDIDYIVLNDCAITKLSNWLLSFNAKKVFLTYSELSEKLAKTDNVVLRQLSNKRASNADIEVNFEKTTDYYNVSYKIGKWNNEIFPIVYKENYSILDFDNITGYAVEI